MGLMVRICLILLCPVLVSGSAFAFPKLSAGDQAPLLVLADDDDAVNVWKPTEQDCRRFPSWASEAECARYLRPPPAREKPKQEPASAQKKLPRPPQPPGPARLSKKAAVRPQSEPERNAAAPRPLAAVSSGSVPLRAMPGKTMDERLKYMVGQLVLTGFSGRQPDEPDVERVIHGVRDGKISGVIVRDSNVAGFQQLRRLLLAVANAGGETPPLLAIDQPGGPDTVLSEEKGFAFYGSASSVSSGSAYEAQLLYRAMAGELAALGVNFNIGPSQDACREDGVNLSAFCFGAIPSRIAAFARAFNFGHHDRGVLTALRHAPFRSGLRSSWINERASSAILHLLVKGETSDALVVRVKAMEPMALTEVAFAWRQKKGRAPGGRSFGFDGALIFELDMGPGGAPIRYDEAILRAFQAGADMILVREPSSIPAGLYNVSLDALRAGIKSGRLPAARIVEAYKHVQRLKARLRASPSRTKVAGLERPEAARAPNAR